MQTYTNDAESDIGILKSKNKELFESLSMLEKMVNESVSGIYKPSIMEWSSALSKCQDALEANKP